MNQMMHEVWSAIQAAHSFLVLSHKKPDGDAITSCLAFAALLQAIGKSVTLFNVDPVPQQFSFLPDSDKFRQTLPAGSCFDAVVVLDCAVLEKIGEAALAGVTYQTMLNIDHHAKNTRFGDYCYVDSEAAACGAVVYDLIQLAGIPLSSSMALSIYTSLLVDTGSFRYNSATPRSFLLAGEMVSHGVKPWTVASHIYENEPLAKLKLLGAALGELELSKEGRIACMSISQAMLKKNGASLHHTQGLINYGRAVAGVEISVLLREYPDGVIRVSLRSIDGVDLLPALTALQGGGSHYAGGAYIAESMANVKQRVLEALDREIRWE